MTSPGSPKTAAPRIKESDTVLDSGPEMIPGEPRRQRSGKAGDACVQPGVEDHRPREVTTGLRWHSHVRAVTRGHRPAAILSHASGTSEGRVETGA